MNAPSTFQRLMQVVLHGQEGNASSYIDDILVYSNTWEAHLKHVREVLLCLRRHGLRAKPSKCVWGAKELEYLGRKVSRGRVAVPDARIMAVKAFKMPVTKRDVRSFLGTVGFYSKFIHKFAEKSRKLTAATRKAAPSRRVKWTSQMKDEFVVLRMIHCVALLC